MLPCNAGMACLPLQAGGDAGSGYGYCTELGQQAATGASAITISNRTSETGIPCRLPVVYKCAPLSCRARAPATHYSSLTQLERFLILSMTLEGCMVKRSETKAVWCAEVGTCVRAAAESC